jgi:uncharacterized protein YjiS (DUF1127 family)
MTFMTSHASTAELSTARTPSFLGGLLTKIAEYRRIRRNALELHSLSNETLKDIGLDRSEIQRIARFGR